MQERLCLNCQESLVRRPLEGTRDWSNRKFCSKECFKYNQKQEAISEQANYNAAPNTCKQCYTPIVWTGETKLADLKRKNFCSHSCSASFSNPKTKTKLKVHKVETPRPDTISQRSKGLVAKQHIHTHARRVMSGRHKACEYCGYSNFVDVAHIIPVRNFPNDALLSEINHENNLLFLCPNHHAEFDGGLLSLEEILG